MNEWVSLREYARRKGVSDTAVRKAIKSGKISKALKTNAKNGRPLVNPDVADSEWSANHNPAHERVTRSGSSAFKDHADTSNASADVASGSVLGNAGKGGEATFAAAKRAKAVYDAQLARLDYETRAGKLVPKADVYKALYSAGQELRTSLMAIPDRVVDEMLSAPSRNDAHQMLVEAIASSLEALVDIQNRDISAHR
jgi:hypothetical protein